MTIIGYDFYGTNFFRSVTSSVSNIYYAEATNAIYDEIEIRERTDVATDNVQSSWEPDHRAIFKFINDLEGGNINNSGLKIVAFEIRRRRLNELNHTVVGTETFENNVQFEFSDYTQPNDELVYSIVPVAENEFKGRPTDVQVSSEFTGWFVVDKDTNNVLSFDKFIGDSAPMVETTLNRGRTQIEIMSRYPTVFYNDVMYESFTLSTVIIPSEFERSGLNYEKIIKNFIENPKPILVKSGDGRLFVADMHNPRMSTPMNVWKMYDYAEISFDFVEVDSYENYMNS